MKNCYHYIGNGEDVIFGSLKKAHTYLNQRRFMVHKPYAVFERWFKGYNNTYQVMDNDCVNVGILKMRPVL